MNMFEAILSRRSIRSFVQEKIDWNILSDILSFADRLPMLIDDIAVEFKLVSNIEKKQGFHGPFSVKAPYYICLSSEIKEDYLINAGYVMQQLSLYITSKGLGTCYIGLASPGMALKSTMKYEYVITLAFGKTEQALYRNSNEAKRLPEKEVVVYKENVSQDIRQLLTAARLSPSDYNSQPWRFVVYKNRIHVFAKKSNLITLILEKGKFINMGIMLANLLLAAEELWVDVTLTKLESLKNKPLQNNEYIMSILIG